MRDLGIESLYRHQAEAYDLVMGGSDVLVVTGTNSGKSLCYLLPTMQFSLTEPACRALFLFPTKALAQDQLGKIQAMIGDSSIRAATYDGDTPKSQRGSVRKLAHIILSNPDMLHLGILPGHESWTTFLKSLRLIVLDEVHMYRGVFGSHVAGIVRRLLRLCEWHHNRPQIVACTATIGNPKEHFRKLTGRDPVLLDEDGSPQGERTLLFWNPPEVGLNQRLSSNIVSSEVMATLAEHGLQTLAFSRSRVSAELVMRYTKRRIEKAGMVSPTVVDSYRAGYTPAARRQIETALFSGKLRALSATNAMELGVDVGALDAVVLNGYPGTIAGFWQQAGRAGRGTKNSLAIFVAHDDPLEQFLLREPKLVLEGQTENASTNPENAQILGQQLRCAAYERPLSPTELADFGPTALTLAESLDRSGELTFRAGRFFYPAHESPASGVNIRGSGGPSITILVDGSELGTMDRRRAMQSAHEGAVYLHRGASYLSEELDLDGRTAKMTATDVPYYTQPILQSLIVPNVAIESVRVGAGSATLSAIAVTDVVMGYRRKSLDGDTVMSTYELDLPPEQYDTIGVRLDFDAPDSDDAMLSMACAVHTLEHALISVAPLLVGCDRSDLGSAWYAAFPDTLAPALFVFDRTPGGIGLSDALFGRIGEWLGTAQRLVKGCKCDIGCPGCILSSGCECNNENLDKARVLELLRSMVG